MASIFGQLNLRDHPAIKINAQDFETQRSQKMQWDHSLRTICVSAFLAFQSADYPGAGGETCGTREMSSRSAVFAQKTTIDTAWRS